MKRGFVTIRIFARTELFLFPGYCNTRFVTIRIFARTELADLKEPVGGVFCYHKDFC